MAEKQLTEGEWKAFAKGRTLKDDALLKALQACEKADKGPPEGLLQALEKLRKEAQALRKASKGDDAVDKQLGKVLDALERRHKEATQAAADDEASPALLSTKLKPLIRELKGGEVRYPALVCTAGANTAVLIERRSISTSRRKLLSAAVDASGGAKFWPAQCSFEQNALTFVFESVPAKMARRIHTALLAQTELRVKVRVRGPDGSAEEDGETGADDGPDADTDVPGGPSDVTAAPPPPSPAEQAYRTQLQALMPAARAALQGGHAEAQKIRALLGFASEKADAGGDFAAAAKALEMVAGLLAPPPEDPAKAFTARLAALVPRIKAQPQAVADDGAPLGRLAAEAGALAKERRHAEAGALLDRIEAALGGGGGLSLVKLGKARLEWMQAREHARAELGRLKAALEAEYGADADEQQALAAARARLDALVATIDAALEDQLDRLLNAEAAARPPLVVQARALLGRLQQLVQADPVLAQLDGNEYLPDMQATAPMRQRLQDIAAAMS